ncbi:MAG: thioredoxin domain-containing protein [Patescibacteria group bacterium]|jgi:protein-disulfide isomerase
MKYFWQGFAILAGVTAVIFVFFILSLPVRNHITFTDKQAPTVPEITIADPSLGPQNAPVTIVNYGDYQCQACALFESTLKDLRDQYGDKLRIVWKDMPNSGAHGEAISSAIAARCGEKQKKFWEFHSALMMNQSLLGTDLYTKIATDLKLNVNKFSRCFTSQETLPLVQRGYDEGTLLQITTTPTIYLNNVRYSGDLSTSVLKRAIDAILK